ncbi:hypothetical protein MHYP_G00148940 [Metynnis hypsauchen]
MGKDQELLQAVKTEDLLTVQKILQRPKPGKASRCIIVIIMSSCSSAWVCMGAKVGMMAETCPGDTECVGGGEEGAASLTPSERSDELSLSRTCATQQAVCSTRSLPFYLKPLPGSSTLLRL